MNIKIFGVALIATMAVAASWNFNQSKNEVELSDLALTNVEALARSEGEGMLDCPNGCLTPKGVCFCYGYHPYEEAKAR